MFGTEKYRKRIHEIKWYINDGDINDIQDLLFVEFKRVNNEYYLIDKIHFTYVDILCGMEELEFDITKRNKEYKIKIL